MCLVRKSSHEGGLLQILIIGLVQWVKLYYTWLSRSQSAKWPSSKPLRIAKLSYISLLICGFQSALSSLDFFLLSFPFAHHELSVLFLLLPLRFKILLDGDIVFLRYQIVNKFFCDDLRAIKGRVATRYILA